jgi:SAM-dependent methyltransferase
MLDDIQAVADFHATRLGQFASGLLRQRLVELWPDLSSQSLLGLGHAAPLLSAWQGRTIMSVDAVCGHALPLQGATTPGRCLVQDDALPFPDRCFDRVLLAHAIETADATRLLRGVWRTMRDDGRLLIVVPNRTGVWAIHDGTPFADGAPCSVGRIDRLLRRSLFRVERLQGALMIPPIDSAPLLRFAGIAERLGRRLSPRLAGVLLVEAVKDLHAAIPVASRSWSLGTLARPVLAPLSRVPNAQASIPMPYWSSKSK